MQYDDLMRKCIELAQRGEGQVSPNPLVGCVVLDADSNEISCGWHEKYGGNHAERNALLNVSGAHTLIVNLEPCSHHGKTPPCTDLIIEKGIKRVVFGLHDMVNGGADKLRAAGIEVIGGVLEPECRRLNEVFLKNGLFVAIKTATTLDGKIATANGSSKWITSDEARAYGRKIRTRYDAILTSSSTVLADAPVMEHKTKIILDRSGRLTGEERIFQQGDVHVFKEFEPERLYEMGVRSVLVEAGGKLSGELLLFADKIYHFIAPKIIGDNSAKSCFDWRKITDINESLNFKINSVERFGEDLLLTYYPLA
jgi:diaminohydroxyphosphoribosylaminopyrimidine deaminase/5-amino-6-(5-phosphoribosylamino)uracil reductase